jgi:hypothetical protein
MASVRALPMLSFVAAIVLGVATAGQSAAPVRRLPAVLRLVNPRPASGFHIMFPWTWRPITLEVRSPAKKPPLRVFCAACPPGTVLEVDL